MSSSNITYAEENGVHTFSVPWGSENLIIKSGRFAQQASGECTVQYGDTVLLATAVMSKNIREGIDYFPLMVDYDEKLYAAGKIKGSRFIKREGRPSDEAILSGRIVDRSIRPFFNQETRREVQVVVTALSWDGVNDPDTFAVIAASAALHLSNIPWNGPVSAVGLSHVNGEWILNASYEQRDQSQLDLLVSVLGDKAVMIEADGDEAPENLVIEGIERAITEAQTVSDLLNAIREKIGKEKTSIESDQDEAVNQEIKAAHAKVEELVADRMAAAITQVDKETRNSALDGLLNEVKALYADDETASKEAREAANIHFETMLKKATKSLYLKDKKRLDGRGFEQIRMLKSDVGILPRTHGSGLFQRGETQVLSVLTLGAPSDVQILDSMEEDDTKKRYMHHYNFPAYSVGEVRPNRGPGRREIGHGALAEKALERMIPDKETFPYTIRVVSEVMSSNGSSSMASTCGSTLALMDAGVPIKKPIAGIAMGIITDDDRPTEEYVILTDIQGAEDHYGEMDFKITGSDNGITAIQLDVKNTGLTPKMAAETIMQAKKARLEILDVMLKTIPEPRKEMSPYAPRIYTLRIKPEQIGDVIGPKGKIINGIIDETGVAIDIEDDGLVMITSSDEAGAKLAIKRVEDLTRQVAVGETFDGTVTRLMDFGAFVEYLPGREGLVHVSELAPFRVEKVSDVVNVGDKVPVKLIEIDSEGRMNLSIKETGHEYPPEVVAKASSTPPSRPPRNGGGGFRRNNHGGGNRNGGFRGNNNRHSDRSHDRGHRTHNSSSETPYI